MADDTVFRTMLFDFYGELLTDKQREYFDLHYNEDLSLAEIAALSGVSRQAVWDNIRRAESSLREIEGKVGLVERWQRQREALAGVGAELRALLDNGDEGVRAAARRALERLDGGEYEGGLAWHPRAFQAN